MPAPADPAPPAATADALPAEPAPAAPAPAPPAGVQYEYDDLNRLTRVTYENGDSITYEYDAAGNIINVVVEKL